MNAGNAAPKKTNTGNVVPDKTTTTLWTMVLKKGFRPKTQKEVNKAAKTVTAKSSHKQDLRVFLRFSGEQPDEVATELAIRECLTPEEGKGLARVTQTRKAVAMVMRSKHDVDTIMAKKEEIATCVGAEKIETSERWEKFIFRGVTRIRRIEGNTATVSEVDIRRDLKKQWDGEAKKILVIPLANNPEKCNVIVFTGEDQRIGNHVALLGDRIGALRVAEKTTPRQCRNCHMFYIGLCRREAKCENCGRALHGRCEEQTRCGVCHGGHESADPRCPLRPKKQGGQWCYPNEWVVNARRKQTREEIKRKAREIKEVNKNKSKEMTETQAKAGKGKERAQPAWV